MRRGAGRSARPASGGPNAEREPYERTPQKCVRRLRRVPLRSAATRRHARNLIMGDAYLVGILSRPPRGDESDERAFHTGRLLLEVGGVGFRVTAGLAGKIRVEPR